LKLNIKDKPEYTVEIFKNLEKVCFYSISSSASPHNVAIDVFLTVMEEKYRENRDQMMAILGNIGRDGAFDFYFRYPNSEIDAIPNKRERKIAEGRDYGLRIYVYRVSLEVVIVLGGGLKTAYNIADCPNVGPQHNRAKLFLRRLKQIGIDHSGKEITNLDDLYFQL